MSELENGMVITNENNNQAQFDRDNCFIVLNYNRDNETDLYVAFFYCTGSSSSDGTNENLRGNGSGKRLMLDAMIYIQQKYNKLENVSIYPMPRFDPYQIEQIYKDVSHIYIESNSFVVAGSFILVFKCWKLVSSSNGPLFRLQSEYETKNTVFRSF